MKIKCFWLKHLAQKFSLKIPFKSSPPKLLEHKNCEMDIFLWLNFVWAGICSSQSLVTILRNCGAHQA